MELCSLISRRFCIRVGFCLLWVFSVFGQRVLDETRVPSNFNLDMQTAARLRPQLIAQSTAADRSAPGRVVFERLVAQLPISSGKRFAWELRIVDDDQLNAYSSPDGTIYVESGLAELAGPSMGLWAAILSHEIAHVERRDWSRRYLYQKSIESDAATEIVLGDPGLPSVSWTDSQGASEKLARFCRQLEVDADRDGLMLMARAGYHPDFVPALHHLLHARSSSGTPTSLYAMHPCWEERDRELSRAYFDAAIEFEHRWPEWYTSPGGNPPVVVFADAATVKKTASKEWEIQVPMHCENLVGAVEVVLHTGYGPGKMPRQDFFTAQSPEFEQRQVTGCIPPRTTITFTLPDSSKRREPGAYWTDVYVLDAWGAVLARADVPKLSH